LGVWGIGVKEGIGGVGHWGNGEKRRKGKASLLSYHRFLPHHPIPPIPHYLFHSPHYPITPSPQHLTTIVTFVVSGMGNYKPNSVLYNFGERNRIHFLQENWILNRQTVELALSEAEGLGWSATT